MLTQAGQAGGLRSRRLTPSAGAWLRAAGPAMGPRLQVSGAPQPPPLPCTPCPCPASTGEPGSRPLPVAEASAPEAAPQEALGCCRQHVRPHSGVPRWR